MKYGIVGSRSRKDKETVFSFINGLNPDDIVISGGCRGVDSWAVAAARASGLETKEFLPALAGCRYKWELTEAYYARNKQIADACDILIAFVSTSRKGGTENTIKHAEKLGKKVVIIPP